MRNRWQYFVAMIFALLIVGEILWYSPIENFRQGSFDVLDVVHQSEGEMSTTNITYKFEASLPLDAKVVVTPVEAIPHDLPVFVFYDTDYPTLIGTDWILSTVLLGELRADLYLRGYSSGVSFANASELENIMSENKSAIVVMAAGGFPSCVFSKETNLVKPWIKSGGVLVWLGDYIGWYVFEKGMKKEQITYNMTQNFQTNGSIELGLEGFFDYYPSVSAPKAGNYSSPLSDILDTTYDYIQYAPLVHMVEAAGGLTLGKIGGEGEFKFRSSISMVPLGNGKIIIFGFFLMPSLSWDGPQLVARDIAQILCSGVLQMNPGSLPWYRSYNLAAAQTETDVSSESADSNVAGFVILEYTSRQSDGVLFYRKFIGG
jgi:hypothetical protein